MFRSSSFFATLIVSSVLSSFAAHDDMENASTRESRRRMRMFAGEPYLDEETAPIAQRERIARAI